MRSPSRAILNHNLDDLTLEDLWQLRQIRIATAERQLEQFDRTISDLKTRNLISDLEIVEHDLIKNELLVKIEMLTERMKLSPDMVFEDEVSFYADILTKGLNKKH